jgi:TetR/AcrR family transcriptional regulator
MNQVLEASVKSTRDRDHTISVILDAAEHEFATTGLVAARTDAIAARANVAKGMIFHYFKSKEGLYEEVLKRIYEPFNVAIERSMSADIDPADALLSLVTDLLEIMAANPQAPRIFILESIQGNGEHFRRLGMPSIYKSIERVLSRGIRSGIFRPFDPWNGAINIVGLCGFYFSATNNFGLASTKTRDPLSKTSLKRHAEEVLAFVSAAVRVD